MNKLSKPGDPCPNCGRRLMHHGMLHQLLPTDARLVPPVELLRCSYCRIVLRGDGAEYDEVAINKAWREWGMSHRKE